MSGHKSTLYRQGLLCVSIGFILFVFLNAGVSNTFAMSPSVEVSECWKVPMSEQTERCRDLTAEFSKDLKRWKNKNAILNPYTVLAAGTLIIVGGIAIILWLRKRRR